MNITQRIKRLFIKPKPIDWFSENKSIYIFHRENTFNNQIALAILAVPEVNDPLVIIEYNDRYCLEIMVSGGDEQAIAKAIFESKPVGLWTRGNKKILIDFMNAPYEISFSHLLYVMDF